MNTKPWQQFQQTGSVQAYIKCLVSGNTVIPRKRNLCGDGGKCHANQYLPGHRESSVGEKSHRVAQSLIRAFARQAKSITVRRPLLSCFVIPVFIYQGRDKYMINDAQPLAVFFDLRILSRPVFL